MNVVNIEEVKRKVVVYDLETYPNIFTMGVVFGNGKGLRVFEISDRRDDSVEMVNFLRNVYEGGYSMVGFNNLGFDYPIVHDILLEAVSAKKFGHPLDLSCESLYARAVEQIDTMKATGFAKVVPPDQVKIRQIDLYKIHHFDNKARSTSLKMLEFNMRSENIEDLPFGVGLTLTDEQKDELIRYNKHDVMETLKFYHYSEKQIKLREDLSILFGFDCTNFNDTKIGKELFVNRLEESQPGVCYSLVSDGKGGFRKKLNQTKRPKIVIKDCLLPYIKFDRPEFQAVHEWFSRQVITETKGVFTELLESDLGDVAKYAQMNTKGKKLGGKADCDKYGFEWDVKRKRCLEYEPTEQQILDLMEQQPMGWVEVKELKSPKGAKSYYWCYNIASCLNVVIDDFRYDFGVGGIHGAKRGVLKQTDGLMIRTLDVKSYYPNLAISNRVYPAHLGELFCDVYKMLYDERAASDKKSALNAALKLALNGCYGLTT